MKAKTIPPITLRSHRLARVGAGVVVGALLLVGVGCASDADQPTTTTVTGEGGPSSTEASTETTASVEGPATTAGPIDDVGTGEASPEVTAYCEEIDEVAQLMADMRADPSPEAVNEVNARLAELTETATQLIEDHPDEVDRINDCAEVLYAN